MSDAKRYRELLDEIEYLEALEYYEAGNASVNDTIVLDQMKEECDAECARLNAILYPPKKKWFWDKKG